MSQMTMFDSDLDEQEAIKAASTVRKVLYCTVRFTVGWLPGSIAFTEQAKSALASALGIDRKVVRGSYAILGASRDPLIREGAALKRLLSVIRDEYTIPEYTLRATATGKEKPDKVKGSYLIESCKIEEFLQRFNEAQKQYLAWGKRVTEDSVYQRIRESDREALADDWHVIEKKYPSAAAMADGISCDTPKIEPFDASFTLADVAPETSRQLREQAEARLTASVEGATSELILEFKDMVEAVAKNCGKRVRLLPLATSDDAHLQHAEVTQIIKGDGTNDIGKGLLLITVQKVQPKFGWTSGDAKFNNSGKPKELLLSEAEYADLRPYETDEYRQLAQSSFDNLLWLAKKIATVKSMLGNDDGVADLTGLAQEVADTLGNLGGSAGNITKELKGSNFARTTAKNAFGEFHKRLQVQELEIKRKSKVRRKFKVNNEE